MKYHSDEFPVMHTIAPPMIRAPKNLVHWPLTWTAKLRDKFIFHSAISFCCRQNIQCALWLPQTYFLDNKIFSSDELYIVSLTIDVKYLNDFDKQRISFM